MLPERLVRVVRNLQEQAHPGSDYCKIRDVPNPVPSRWSRRVGIVIPSQLVLLPKGLARSHFVLHEAFCGIFHLNRQHQCCGVLFHRTVKFSVGVGDMDSFEENASDRAGFFSEFRIPVGRMCIQI